MALYSYGKNISFREKYSTDTSYIDQNRFCFDVKKLDTTIVLSKTKPTGVMVDLNQWKTL